MKTTGLILFVILLIVIGFFAWQNFLKDDFNLPRDGETQKETIKGKEIMVTDGVKHSVPLDEILAGGPPKDGIPAIDDPKFTAVKEADEWLKSESELGLSLEFEGIKRFYPYRILVAHEVVNDTIAGRRVLITYCPLCFTGIVFDPLVRGERVEFGVSGKLWNSNLLMYDRKTNSLWSQITGEAVLGETTGNRLKIISSDVTRYGIWKRANPDGQVLSRETGYPRSYSSIPYGGDLENIPPFFPLNNKDSRLPDNVYVIGTIIGGEPVAFTFETVKKAGEIKGEFSDRIILVKYIKETDSVRIFEIKAGQPLKQLESVPAFWFSWVAVYPQTELVELNPKVVE